MVLEPGALAPFVAGDVVATAAHAGGIARALQVAADRIARHRVIEAAACEIVVDLHIADDVNSLHLDALCAIGIVVNLHIAADRAALSKAPPGIVIAREISSDREGSDVSEIAAPARTVPNLNIASDGNRPAGRG